MYITTKVKISQPVSQVFDFLKYAKNQKKFSVWSMADPKQSISEQGNDGTVGYIYFWDSKVKNVGAGSQEIIRIIKNESIEFKLNFERPMKNTAQAKFILKEIDQQMTEVTWEFESPSKFPFSLFSLFFKIVLGKDMSKSLNNLKILLEKKSFN